MKIWTIYYWNETDGRELIGVAPTERDAVIKIINNMVENGSERDAYDTEEWDIEETPTREPTAKELKETTEANYPAQDVWKTTIKELKKIYDTYPKTFPQKLKKELEPEWVIEAL